MPSSNVQVASPTIAKSWKSSLGLLDEAHPLLARHRGQRAVLHRRGPRAIALEHCVDVELIFGHGADATQRAPRAHAPARPDPCARTRPPTPNARGLLDHDVGLMRRELAHERAVGP